MIRLSRPNAGVPVLFTLAAALFVAPAPAEAQVKPFKVSGEGIGPTGIPLPGQEPRLHWAVGHATHLGKYFGAGTVRTDSATPHPNGEITGLFGSGSPFVFIGANGDVLTCYYGRTDHGASLPGTFTLIPVAGHPGLFVAHWIAEFVAQPELSSGKFAGVTGSWIMFAVSEPFDPFGPLGTGSTAPVAYSWEGEGWLTFKHGK
jgi:hypothetical protein